MSHFGEGPSFNATHLVPDITAAQQQIVPATGYGLFGPGDGTPDFPGLLQYVGPGEEFGPDTHVQAAIITPRDRHNAQIGFLLYHNMVQQIARYVTNMFCGDWDAQTIGSMAYPVEYVDYTPQSNRRVQQWTAASKAIFQYDPVQA